MFAKRTGWDLTSNRLTLARERLARGGARALDLTESNPTRAGLTCPTDLLKPLADPANLLYEPDPKGWLPAREALASLFARKGARVDPRQILLTASTSEAYSFLFRLLADPGDEILVPGPSYPLFDHLAQLSDLRVTRYPLRLEPAQRWALDVERLEEAAGPRARILIVVHPNNPTGSCVRRAEQEQVLQFCRRRQIALVSDEVFAEYRWNEDEQIPATLLRESDVLHFALGGLSKLLGLPQMKLAWIACSGPETEVKDALGRLELIADTALSVNTPAQRALPVWLQQAQRLQGQIRSRLAENRRFLSEAIRAGDGELLPSDGGWSAVLHLPGIRDEEEWCLRLLERRQVWVHPGYFFEFEQPGILVVSLLVSPDRFQEGIQRLLAEAAA